MSHPEKIKYLNSLKKEYGSIRVHYVNIPEDELWQTDKTLLELSESELETANLIRIKPSEIILDLEEKEGLQKIIDKLTEKSWSYEIWDTGSRGYHIYLEFKELIKYNLDTRNSIRKKIIREFECDESKSSESTWIAMPWANHIKTKLSDNKIKTRISKVGNYSNKIPEEVIKYAEQLSKMREEKIIENDEDFKNYKQDPYLRWTLSTVINNGGRNNILFKNLAIGLVKSGLSREDIMKYAQIIVKNCPGKNTAEFMGWADKTIAGDLSEYNKYELVQWSLENDHPIMYKLEDGKESLLALFTTKQIWRNVWVNKPILSQELWMNICFHNMLGTILTEREGKDLRIHSIFTSPTSSGKDEGVDLVRYFLEEIGFKTSVPSSITDKTLVGGMNQTIKENNDKYNLTEDNNEHVRGKTTYTYRDPKEVGELGSADWMAIPESEFVFKPGSFNRNLQTILRQAMDNKREIQKGVGGEMIKVYTNTSFLITTYPIPDAMVKILNNGIFQRCLYYNRILDDEDREIIDEGIRKLKFNKAVNTEYDDKEWKTILIERLKLIREWYTENKDNIELFDGMDLYIGKKIAEYKQTYNILNWQDRGIMNAIITRGYGILERLILHNTIYKMKLKIDKEDVDDAFDLFFICADSVKMLLLKDTSINKEINTLCLILKDGKKSKMEVHKILQEKLEMNNINKRTNLIKAALDKGDIQCYKEGRNTYLHMEENPIADVK